MDSMIEEFILRECVANRGIIPMGRKRRIARKVYKWMKAAFFGVPVSKSYDEDIMTKYLKELFK
jgi:hypothetical protein